MEVLQKDQLQGLKERVEKALELVRPYLQIDGGDVELVRVREDGIVELRWIGACLTCPLSLMTLRAGVERTLMREIAEVKRVEAVN